jgi:hypothetical protein
LLRGDLSNRLIHLTRGETREQAAANFASIIADGRLRGGTGLIRGGYRCVCFSEAPIAVLSQLLAAPAERGMRYAPFGVMVSKRWLFAQGGRPVIYQTHDEYDALPDAMKYRHVRYEPHHNIDHTWEREWRIHADELALDANVTTFVVPTREWEQRFFEQHANEQRRLVLNMGEDGWMYVDQFPWHFIALEDLGVEITE